MAAVEAAATRVLGLCQSNRGPGALGPCVERRGEAWSRRARSRSRSRARVRVQSSRLPASGVAGVAALQALQALQAAQRVQVGHSWSLCIVLSERPSLPPLEDSCSSGACRAAEPDPVDAIPSAMPFSAALDPLKGCRPRLWGRWCVMLQCTAWRAGSLACWAAGLLVRCARRPPLVARRPRPSTLETAADS
jgi:hypothetical protein